jgi:FAD/FMN-containing dehydrogenase
MRISRRGFLNGMAAASGASALGSGLLLGPTSVVAAKTAWPSAAAWDALRRKVGGRLVEVVSPLAPCLNGKSGAACAARLEDFKNPFFIQDQPGGLQSNGWLDAWTAAISPFAVAAESAADVAAAVDFARTHGVRLVVKGAGHDYKGRSSAPDSLLVWTHRMRAISIHENFRPTGAPPTAAGVAALTAGAGTRWIEAYQAAAAHGRYVQGGGCTSVGVAGGFIQGGGYGSFSKRFGTGAGGVLEFEVVTADGKVRVANEFQNSDLFWALRGGGGGTFGIVTKVTLLAHPMPRRIGFLRGRISASNDDAFRRLLAEFVDFYPGALNNPTWGEQIAVRTDNALGFFMTYLDLSEAAARAVWAPLVARLAGRPKEFDVQLNFVSYPFAATWDAAFWKKTEPNFITEDKRPDAQPHHFWWTANDGEVAEFIYSYQSRWLPESLFHPDSRSKLVQTLFDASRHASLRLQINKGLAGAAPEAIARDRKTSIHPAVFDAATIVIVAARKPQTFPGVAGHAPNLGEGRRVVGRLNKAMQIIRDATPGSAAYGNESDYFEQDWKRVFYGDHYDRLLAIKRKYDPGNLFRVHHGVGSDL